MVHMIDASFEIYDSYENDIFSLTRKNILTASN